MQTRSGPLIPQPRSIAAGSVCIRPRLACFQVGSRSACATLCLATNMLKMSTCVWPCLQARVHCLKVHAEQYIYRHSRAGTFQHIASKLGRILPIQSSPVLRYTQAHPKSSRIACTYTHLATYPQIANIIAGCLPTCSNVHALWPNRFSTTVSSRCACVRPLASSP